MPHAPFSIPCLYESVHESNRITIYVLLLLKYVTEPLFKILPEIDSILGRKSCKTEIYDAKTK
ncbi:hypothetical protein [aff. Roholtiella sp. LEGE 12411]